MNWFVRITARMLTPDECEIALGDLTECDSSGSRSLFNILGLVARRQLQIWTTWRPWFALIFIIGLSGFFLSRMLAGLSIEIFEQVTAWRRYGVHSNTGVTSFRDDVIYMSCLAVAIFCWTAVNASLLRRLSGRGGWLTGLLFYVVVFYSSTAWSFLSGAAVYRANPPRWTAIRWILPLNSESGSIVSLFAIAAIWGFFGRSSGITPATVLFTLAAAVLGGRHARDLQTFSNGAFPAPPWSAILAPYALVGWPVLARRWLSG